MIDISKIANSEPFFKFKTLYNEAIEKKQFNIEAICISSYDSRAMEVDSRFVNLKYIIDDKFIFFTNFLSPKAQQFNSHEQVSGCFFWNNTNVQIRIKGRIQKCDTEFSDNHFINRSKEKNVLAISSTQSKEIKSYDEVKKKYRESFNKYDGKRPNFWGGYSIKCTSIEFWKGNKSRLNQRNLYKKKNKKWIQTFLEP